MAKSIQDDGTKSTEDSAEYTKEQRVKVSELYSPGEFITVAFNVYGVPTEVMRLLFIEKQIPHTYLFYFYENPESKDWFSIEDEQKRVGINLSVVSSDAIWQDYYRKLVAFVEELSKWEVENEGTR